MKLIIGNKNYSTWSLRPWLALSVAGIRFDEQLVPFESAAFTAVSSGLSGSGRVPVLIDGDIVVWESLAILEYLAETHPEARLWPADKAARAHARTIANEMHAGFQALRNALPMNIARRVMKRDLSAAVVKDVRRIDALWSDCRTRFGVGGPFLFGAAFCNADAMFAPVVSRFHTYGVDVGPVARAYMQTILGLPAFKSWAAAAVAEPWIFPEDEIDWPSVHRA